MLPELVETEFGTIFYGEGCHRVPTGVAVAKMVRIKGLSIKVIKRLDVIEVCCFADKDWEGCKEVPKLIYPFERETLHILLQWKQKLKEKEVK